MKEKIQKLREFLSDATKALGSQKSDEAVTHLTEIAKLADEMHEEAEKTEETIESLTTSAESAQNLGENLAKKMQEMTDAINANKTAIEKFADIYAEDSEALADTLVKMSRAKPSKQNEGEDEGGEEEKQPLSKTVFNF